MKRRGSIYLVVLATTALVVTMAMVGLELAGRDVAAANGVRDAIAARTAAESGIDYATAFMQQSKWRTKVGDGVIARNKALGSSTFAVTLKDETGDITMDSLDAIRVISVGSCGTASVTLEASAKPLAIPPEHFDNVACAQTNLNFNSAKVMGTGTIRGGGNASALLANITQFVQVTGTVSGLTYLGGSAPLIPGTGPTLGTIDWTAVLSYYQRVGTAVGTLVADEINGQVVAQDVTPWGVTNANGVYVVNCNNRSVRIRNSRIVGTLVLINASKGVTIDQGVSWVSGTTGYPALICDGAVQITTDGNVLSEAIQGINFNPTGAAGTDRVGVTDSDKLDTYTNSITGLLCAKSLSLEGKTKVAGVVVSQTTISFMDSPTLTYDATVKTKAPAVFSTPGAIFLVEYSWKRTLN